MDYDMEDLEEMMNEGCAPTVDGCCTVELDGTCCHGSPSVFLVMGLI